MCLGIYKISPLQEGIYKISPLQEGAYLITALIVLLGGHPVSLLDVHLLRPGPHLVHHVDVALLEVVSQLKLALHQSDFSFHFSEGVAKDCQEHVEKDKEDEEHKAEKVDRTEELVGFGNVKEVEVAQD